VQRDLDLIREILLLVEADPQCDGTREYCYQTPEEFGIHGHSTEEVAYHLALLIQAGFVDGAVVSKIIPMHVIRSLTWNGHEFLDNVRDKGIWNKTKERVQGLSSVGLDVVAAIAKAELMKRLHLT
jgi:hypothetical protein